MYGITVHNGSMEEKHAACPLSAQRLRLLHGEGNAKGVLPAMADKLRKLLFAIETAATVEQLGRFPGWKAHPLKGAMKGFPSLKPSALQCRRLRRY
jgi:hypothetical protein